MVLYPQQLHPTVIHVCFSCFPRDVTLISEADLQHLGLVDMVIAGGTCQGHSRAGAGQGRENLRSNLFFGPHPPHPVVVFPPTFPSSLPLLGDSRDKVLEGNYYVCQHVGDLIFVDIESIGCCAHRLGGFGPTSLRLLFWLQHFL